MTNPRKGRCLCGGVAFEATLHAPGFDVCHCSTCRKWCGGPVFACHVVDLSIAEGMPVQWFDSSEQAERGFCRTCGTHLFWRLKGGGYISVLAGAFDDTADLSLTAEIFVDEQPDSYRFANDATRMTGAEVFATFPEGT